ncbi:MAG: glucose-6-phosphate isomerase [Burkholderiales bacterium]|nr:glucose-6-phosphate isomerase [Burkholderiales bacterium]
MNTTPPTDCPAWRKLQAHAESWRDARLGELFAGDPQRARTMRAEAPGLRLDYSRQRLGALTLRLLAQLADERGFEQWRSALFAGEKINSTEDRAAGHIAARRQAPVAGLPDPGRYARIVNLGTGGSDLGPRLLADAFGAHAPDVRFVANLDPLELERAIAGAQADSTLVVVASKTFTTQETLANANALRQKGFRNFVAATANPGAARRFGATEVFEFSESVGGRYSVWSAASLAAQIAIGAEAFAEFLAGGREMDEHFRAEPLLENVPALMALVGAWNVNFLGMHAHAVLPYCHRLRLLPAYLQQLEMESNGKRVDREGRPAGYATCPVVFGAEGTPSQHSFHQLLHQGTAPVAVDFIDAAVNDVLTANLRAQANALALGTGDAALPPHRQHPGNRPSSILTFRSCTPRDLGRLIALYEHKVFAQGVLWNINSFDQWGVELGKQLAQRIMEGR